MKMIKRGEMWYADFRIKGKRYKRSLGTSKKALAEKAFTKLKYEIEVKQLGLPVVKKVVFAKFVDDFLDWYKMQNAKKSHQDYKNLFKSTLVPYFGDYYLHDINTELIERYKIMRSKKIRPASVNKELTALKTLFNRAIDWNRLTVNPLARVKKLRVAEKSFRFLSLDEIDLVLNACPGYIYPLILTAIHAGLRRSELFRLQWEDIDFDRKVLIVKSIKNQDEHSKNYKNRAIPMTGLLYDCLLNLKRRSDYAFVKQSGERYTSNVTKTLLTIIADSGVKPFSLHDLRHTFASHLVMDGVDLPTVQKLMGHASITTTMIYTHLAPDHLKQAISRLDQRFSGNKMGTVLKMPAKRQALST